MKPVVCVFLMENRNGPIFFGTTAECKKNIDIKLELQYIFVDIGISGDELDCKRSLYGDYKNVRFVKIVESFFQSTKMLSAMERLESGIFVVWNDYLKNKKMPYKSAGFDHCIWVNDVNLDKIDELIQAVEKDPHQMLYRSDCDGFSQYGAFNVYKYQVISEDQLLNKQKDMVTFL